VLSFRLDLRRLLYEAFGSALRSEGTRTASAEAERLSLLSVVRCRRSRRFMAVDEIEGDTVVCAWVEGGIRRTASFNPRELEVVPAVLQGPDEHAWREAFRAASHRKIG
jgi:hypothetical protein